MGMILDNGGTPTILIYLPTDDQWDTGKTGATLTVYLSKAGGTPAAATNSASEVDAVNFPGLYSLALTASETDTDGALAVRATASGADPFVDIHEVRTSISATMSSTERNAVADHLLRRSLASAIAGSDGDTVGLRSLLGAACKLVNRVELVTDTITIYQPDDSTSLGTQTVTQSNAYEQPTKIDTD